jgi:hypothetical protein
MAGLRESRDMYFCRNCGVHILFNYRYCPLCGLIDWDDIENEIEERDDEYRKK